MRNNEFLNQEIKKIVTEKTYPYPMNLCMAGAYIMGHYKGINLKILDLTTSNAIADYFVLGSAANPTQASSMADEIAKQMREHGHEALSREGLKHSTDWILLDYGNVIFHIFLESARTVYSLEQLYQKAMSVEIPAEYYYGDGPDTISATTSSGGYF
jgi:ribosome-associated protein